MSSSGVDIRTKGKRFRKPQSGSSNLNERWKYLSVATADDVVYSSNNNSGRSRQKTRTTPASGALALSKQQRQHPSTRVTAAAAPTRVGYDIDGDGQIDVREMRLAKFLDVMVNERQHAVHQQPMTESELVRMRQDAGRLLIAKEFVERNHDRLWRYGAVFTGKTEQQSAEFIASHTNFQKLMPHLENLERKRTIRSSQNVRGCVQTDDAIDSASSGETRQRDAQTDAQLVRQTWIETSRKAPDSSSAKHPLPALQPPKRASLTEIHSVASTVDANMSVSTRRSSSGSNNQQATIHPGVRVNANGAIDVDGKTINDDDKRKHNAQIKNTTLGDHSHNLSDHSQRVMWLKGSYGVSNCLAQQPSAELQADPSHAMDFRRVRDRSELLVARKELLKPPELRVQVHTDAAVVSPSKFQLQLRAVREDHQEPSRAAIDLHAVGLPRIFETPVRIEATGSMSVTKWKYGL